MDETLILPGRHTLFSSLVQRSPICINVQCPSGCPLFSFMDTWPMDPLSTSIYHSLCKIIHSLSSFSTADNPFQLQSNANHSSPRIHSSSNRNAPLNVDCWGSCPINRFIHYPLFSVVATREESLFWSSLLSCNSSLCHSVNYHLLTHFCYCNHYVRTSISCIFGECSFLIKSLRKNSFWSIYILYSLPSSFRIFTSSGLHVLQFSLHWRSSSANDADRAGKYLHFLYMSYFNCKLEITPIKSYVHKCITSSSFFP